MDPSELEQRLSEMCVMGTEVYSHVSANPSQEYDRKAMSFFIHYIRETINKFDYLVKHRHPQPAEKIECLECLGTKQHSWVSTIDTVASPAPACVGDVLQAPDENVYTTRYRCSRGHDFAITRDTKGNVLALGGKPSLADDVLW